MKRFTVVLVCTGNLCRSPMAEGILNDLILDETSRKRVAPPIDVFSAGTHAVDGQPASRHAVTVAGEHGISLRFHRSRRLTADLVRHADLVLAMDRGHVDAIRRICPDAGHVSTVKEYGRSEPVPGMERGIDDPYGGDLEDYRAVYGELREEIVRIAEILFPRVMNCLARDGVDS